MYTRMGNFPIYGIYSNVLVFQRDTEPLRWSSVSRYGFGWTYVFYIVLHLEEALTMRGDEVGAMFYISPQLTLLMLTVVPPVSLGAVRYPSIYSTC